MIVHILHGVLIAYRDVAGPVFFFMWAVIFRSRSILGNGGGTVFTEAREFLECAAVAFGLALVVRSITSRSKRSRSGYWCWGISRCPLDANWR
jgi:hypothetical protein